MTSIDIRTTLLRFFYVPWVVDLLYLVCALCTGCHKLLALLLGAIGRLGSMFVVIPGHLLCHFHHENMPI